MKKFWRGIFLLGIIATLVLSQEETASAALSKVPTSKQVEEVVSSENLEEEYYKVRTPLDEDYTIYVEGKTKISTKRFAIRISNHASSGKKYYITVFVKPNSNGEFSIKINTKKGNTNDAVAYKGTVTKSTATYGSCPGYKAVETIPAGYYHLTIARATTTSAADVSKGADWYNGTLGGSKGYCYKEALFRVKSGEENNLKLVKYPEVIENNTTLKASHNVDGTNDSVYLDKYMKDLDYMFKNPKTGVKTAMTKSRVAYIEKVAGSITKGAENDYEKLLKIYEYVAENFYYDQYAFDTGKYQYANPYLNIYNLRNSKSSANSSGGKVATTCQGYASAVILLARAEGIPARIVNGHHISYPGKIWSDKTASQVSQISHWWAEAYVDGRWIIIDANAGSGNKWERTSFSASGTWRKWGLTSYIGFDPELEQFSNCYAYITIFDGETENDLLTDENEETKLRTFLNKTSSGVKNGKRLNSKYSSADVSTWGTGKTGNLEINSSGKVTKINWPGKKLYGAADFRNFDKLETLTIYTNKLTSLKVSGCTSLKYLSANYNNITSFDGTNASALKTIRLKGNKLTSAKFWVGSKKVTISRKTSVGSFGVLYSADTGKITICSESKNIPSGYKYLKIYDGSKLKKTIDVKDRKSYSYSFKPQSTSCYIKYTKTK